MSFWFTVISSDHNFSTKIDFDGAMNKLESYPEKLKASGLKLPIMVQL